MFFLKQSVTRRIEVTTHSFTTIPALVSGSDRLATLHRRLATQAQLAFPIVILELPFRMPPMRQTMQWHKHRAQTSRRSGSALWFAKPPPTWRRVDRIVVRTKLE